MPRLARISSWIGAVAVSSLIAISAINAQDQPPEASPAQIETWVEQLNSESYQDRETATQRLTQAGPNAIAEVTKAAQNGSPETVWRSVSILEGIGANGSEETLVRIVGSLNMLAKKGSKRAGELGASLQQEWQLNRHENAVVQLRKLGAKIDLPQLTAQSSSPYPGGFMPGYSPYGSAIIVDDMSATFLIEESLPDSFVYPTMSEPLDLPLVPLEEEEESADEERTTLAKPIADAPIDLSEPEGAEADKPDVDEPASDDVKTPDAEPIEIPRPIPSADIFGAPAGEAFEVGDTIVEIGEPAPDVTELIDSVELDDVIISSFDIAEIEIVGGPAYGGGFMAPPAAYYPQQTGSVQIDKDWKGGVEGLRYLRDLLNVNQVTVDNFAINKDAFAHLADMPSLNVLTLNHCRYEQAEVAEFRKQKPDVDVRIFNQAVLGIAGPPEQKPFIITHVQPQTGAAEAGLKAGDIVRSIDGKPIADFSELTFHIAGKGVGDVLAIEFEREGKTMVRKATLGDRAKLNQ